MNIEQKHIDDLSLEVSMTIGPADYAERVKKSLNEFRRHAEIKGFRKGMVPMGLVQKMHGRTALLEEVNKLISEGINGHMNDNKIQIIGEPLPSEAQPQMDWDHAGDFTFVFDLMLAPKVSVQLTADDHIPYKEAVISAKDKEEYTASMLRQFGQLQDAEAVEEEDFIKVDLVQGNNAVLDTYVSLKTIEKKALKKPFMGAKVGDEFEIDVVKTFPNETDRAALLKVKKEELDNEHPVYQVKIKEVKRFAPAEFNQELYDKVFGPDQVHNQEAFEKKIEERMQQEFAGESDYRFMLDARNYVIEKSNIALPEMLLKRWLRYSNEGKFSMEEIERDFEAFAKDLRWQMIREFMMQEHKLEITKEDMLSHAVKVAQYQFAMYGLNSVPQEHLVKYAESLLANEKEAKRIFEKVEDDKVVDLIKSQMSLKKEKVPYSEMRQMNASAN